MFYKIFNIILILLFTLTGVFANSNKKIDDIKGIKNPNDLFAQFMYYQVFIIILLILLYFYYRIFIDKKNIINVTNLNNDSFKREELLNKLKDFKKNNLELNKSDFYQQLNTLFRNYFTILGFTNSDILTLKEIKELDLNKILINLFEKSYLNEFSDKNDTTKERVELIDKFIKLIK